MPTVRVEFYGLARLRAERAEVLVAAATVGDALAAADAVCSGLRSRCDKALSPEYRLSIDGTHFTDDLSEPLAEGQSLIVLGADAGG